MALKPSANCLLVTPTGDNNETERGRLVVVQNDDPRQKILRGVVEAVGCQVPEDIRRGNVAHYNNYVALGDKHIVPNAHLVAYEDDE